MWYLALLCWDASLIYTGAVFLWAFQSDATSCAFLPDCSPKGNLRMSRTYLCCSGHVTWCPKRLQVLYEFSCRTFPVRIPAELKYFAVAVRCGAVIVPLASFTKVSGSIGGELMSSLILSLFFFSLSGRCWDGVMELSILLPRSFQISSNYLQIIKQCNFTTGQDMVTITFESLI